MCDKNGPCMNVQAGFDCMDEYEKNHPGNKKFFCEWCGIYTASEPRCNCCEEEEDG